MSAPTGPRSAAPVRALRLFAPDLAPPVRAPRPSGPEKTEAE